jgi:hypothetical protein
MFTYGCLPNNAHYYQMGELSDNLISRSGANRSVKNIEVEKNPQLFDQIKGWA